MVVGQGTGPRLDASLLQQFTSADDQARADLAASVWSVCREMTRRAALHTLASTGLRRLAVAGDWTVYWIDSEALQSAGRLDSFWSQPGARGGAAAGVAWLVQHHVLAAPRPGRESVAV
jgi:predicted NodU family carbamoyl transferase